MSTFSCANATDAAMPSGGGENLSQNNTNTTSNIIVTATALSAPSSCILTSADTSSTNSRRVHYELMSSGSESDCCSSGRHSPENSASIVEENGSVDGAEIADLERPRSSLRRYVSSSGSAAARRRTRTVSGSMSAEDHVVRLKDKVFYTAGRPPWFDCHGTPLHEPFIIGICGGSASGKTTVAERIIAALDVQWVTLLSMDSFYKVLTEEQHETALMNNYNFDHPDAFDFELLRQTLQRLKEGKCVQVPVYSFATHRREKRYKTMYGASVLIFEGIMAFHQREILNMMDLKIFVDTDSDTRLARRLQRDVSERARDVEGVFKQYFRYVKPAFDSFIAPSMRYADIVVPRGGDNNVAIDLVAQNIKARLTERECFNRAQLASTKSAMQQSGLIVFPVPPSLHLLPQTTQVRGLHTFIRNRETSRNEFIFYAHRLMRLLLEHALSYLPFETTAVTMPDGRQYVGKRRKAADKICGVSILRAGETLEPALREVVKDCVVSKMLIQTNPHTLEPELYYLRLPKDVHLYHVLLLDATVATGAAAIMAIRILLDHDVPAENIFLVSLLMAEAGVQSVAYAFPDVKLITTAIDPHLSDDYHILPGLGNFGDRYFGTERISCGLESDDYDGNEEEREEDDEVLVNGHGEKSQE